MKIRLYHVLPVILIILGAILFFTAISMGGKKIRTVVEWTEVVEAGKYRTRIEWVDEQNEEILPIFREKLKR
ncbi:MAG: hypothetical protein HQ594_03550 [Candidatus Omnitrophica bacterium]|nr:hypothetical protein [Candidatus Omnitrophota bacterium]